MFTVQIFSQTSAFCYVLNNAHSLSDSASNVCKGVEFRCPIILFGAHSSPTALDRILCTVTVAELYAMRTRWLFRTYLPLCALIAVTAVRVVQGEDNLYDVLGVSNSASSREIRSAYKRLAKQW